ncbi:SET domain-containing protein 5 [Sporothrix stenoceras]|uniref:SET domain-containing protein 5 n=1 Tax=Sporothrix stenoceras TaxID=5173 RepID=A0ABR3YKB8_9PEZI
MAIVATVAALLAILALSIQIITIVTRNDEQARSHVHASKTKQQIEILGTSRVEYDEFSSDSDDDLDSHYLTTPTSGYLSPARSPYELRPSPGKGLGVFATRWIPKHTRVLVEAPQFVIVPPDPSAPPIANDILSQIQARFDNLTPTDQAIYEACHQHQFPGEPDSGRLFYIFRSNAFSIVPVDVLDGQHWGTKWGMFPQMARINHSCRPNVANLWVPSVDGDNGARKDGTGTALGHHVVWTTRDIAPGEELLISYVNLLQDTTARQRSLDQFGFQCGCSVCCDARDGNTMMDDWRVQIGDLLRRIQDVVVGDKPLKNSYVRDIDDLIRLLKAEDEDDGLAGYLPRAYCLAATLGHPRYGKIEADGVID